MSQLRTYECRIDRYFEDGSALVSNHIGKSPAAARYAFWRDKSDCLAPYIECFRFIKSKCIGEALPEHFFGDADMFARVCMYRGIPDLRMGMMVDVDGVKGYVVGANVHSNLNVLVNGAVHNVHPTWETTFFDKGEIVYNFKQNK